jgi:hypothetical protein
MTHKNNKVARQGDIQTGRDYQKEIDRLRKDIEGLRSDSQIATLETQIEELKKQKVNAQVSKEQSMTNMSGYEEEFERLKRDEITRRRNVKKQNIQTSFTRLVINTVLALIAYDIRSPQEYTKLGTTLAEWLKKGMSFIASSTTPVDDSAFNTIVTVLTVILFLLAGTQALRLIRSVFDNPEVIPESSLSSLSLTAKEHILDPKGSVIREKYGEEKWTSITHT